MRNICVILSVLMTGVVVTCFSTSVLAACNIESKLCVTCQDILCDESTLFDVPGKTLVIGQGGDSCSNGNINNCIKFIDHCVKEKSDNAELCTFIRRTLKTKKIDFKAD